MIKLPKVLLWDEHKNTYTVIDFDQLQPGDVFSFLDEDGELMKYGERDRWTATSLPYPNEKGVLTVTVR